ncbi:TAXI family TRAP transporter solute-binding subunit [Candidatus Raskinella chloraquaticus]|uniref:C4-dicarboxylate ABC transporter n=2 Tax=Candidatus Raskinella chloraquaticus TaxID=1951219 RepID=A0A1W9I507_9HYPH|nr:MAG: hypothetical protein A4S15_04690 [Proteobacteria bacterium SG_bin8]
MRISVLHALKKLCLFAALLTMIVPRTATAQALAELPGRNDINSWTVGLAGGLLEGSYIRYAADLARALNDGSNLRIIPMVTFGAVGNVSDLLYLKGVDIAITQADVLDYFEQEQKIPGIKGRIHYISPLFLSEVHIYARSEFKSLADLAGKKVAFNTVGSAANLTGQIVFRRLGITVEPVFINNAIALEQMRTGEISAVVHVVAKPNDAFTRYKPEPGFHFLPVEYNSIFADFYLPTALEATDYPNLIPAGGKVQTIAVLNLLAVFNWASDSDRYRRVSRFINAFFNNYDKLKTASFQAKWAEINFAGTVPGWTRYRVAEEALAKFKAGGPNQERLRSQFEEFFKSFAKKAGNRKFSESEREALFKQFVEWEQKR